MSDKQRPQPLEEVIARYLEQLEWGESPDREQLLRDHPQLADSLRGFFVNHDKIQAAVGGNAQDETTINPAEDVGEDATIPPGQSSEDTATIPPSGSVESPTIGTSVRYFGDYELLEEIARGGMGVVYKARQVNLNRIVALKMILSGQLAGEEDVKRFRAEAEAAANLDHPGIVPIFEIGEYEGQHYFSMGFVEGESLADKIKEGPLPPRVAAEYVQKIAEAMAFAHQRGVIHRDLKPANVLVDRNDQPKVTDFGLAKKTQADSGLTATGQVLGTPSYMPPEQAAGKIDDITESADVYSLGAILYALLTGRPPFQAASTMDTLLQVLEREPIPPRLLNPALHQDLDTICLKCLSKRPSNRYGTASLLASDLRRWQAGEPIYARPVSAVERFVRWCRRKPVPALMMAALIVGIVASTYSTWFAFQQVTEANQKSAALSIRVAQDAVQRGENAEAALWFAKAFEESPAGADLIRLAAGSNLAYTAKFLHKIEAEWSSPPQAAILCVTPDGHRLVESRKIRRSGQDPLYHAVIWHLEEGGRQLARLRHPDPVTRAAVTDDGKLVATASGKRIRLWTFDGKPLPFSLPLASERQLNSLRFSQDGSRLGYHDGRIMTLIDSSTGKVQLQTDENHESILAFALGPSGKRLATLRLHRGELTIRCWDADTQRIAWRERLDDMSSSLIHGMQFVANGGLLVVNGLRGGKGGLFDALTGKRIPSFTSVPRTVFGYNGSGAKAIALDGTNVNLVDLFMGRSLRSFEVESAKLVHSLGIDDSAKLFFIHADGFVWIWDLASEEILGQPIPVAQDSQLHFHQRRLVVQTKTTLRVWDLNGKSPAEVPTLTAGREIAAFADPNPSLPAIALAQFGRKIDFGNATFVARQSINKRFVAVGTDDGAVRMFDRDKSDLIAEPLKFPNFSRVFAVSAEGNLAVRMPRKVVRVWDTRGRRPLSPPLRHATEVSALSFDEHGKLLVTADADGDVRVWVPSIGQQICPPIPLRHEVEAVGIRGDRILAKMRNGKVLGCLLPGLMEATGERVRRWTELSLGVTLDPTGGVTPLEGVWQDKRTQLVRRGGTPSLTPITDYLRTAETPVNTGNWHWIAASLLGSVMVAAWASDRLRQGRSLLELPRFLKGKFRYVALCVWSVAVVQAMFWATIYGSWGVTPMLLGAAILALTLLSSFVMSLRERHNSWQQARVADPGSVSYLSRLGRVSFANWAFLCGFVGLVVTVLGQTTWRWPASSTNLAMVSVGVMVLAMVASVLRQRRGNESRVRKENVRDALIPRLEQVEAECPDDSRRRWQWRQAAGISGACIGVWMLYSLAVWQHPLATLCGTLQVLWLPCTLARMVYSWTNRRLAGKPLVHLSMYALQPPALRIHERGVLLANGEFFPWHTITRHSWFGPQKNGLILNLDRKGNPERRLVLPPPEHKAAIDEFLRKNIGIGTAVEDERQYEGLAFRHSIAVFVAITAILLSLAALSVRVR